MDRDRVARQNGHVAALLVLILIQIALIGFLMMLRDLLGPCGAFHTVAGDLFCLL